MPNYLSDVNLGQSPQMERTPGRTDEVENSSGGYVFAVDKWTRLNRWLVLGSEGGSYYADERKATIDNVNSLLQCVAEDGPRTVATIVDISVNGRAPKNDPALFALAVASVKGDEATRIAAYQALDSVARIGTHLFHFAQYREQVGGWTAGLRRAVSRWYTDKDERKLALEAVKYPSRDGWSHRDLVRLAKPEYNVGLSANQRQIVDYIHDGKTPEGDAEGVFGPILGREAVWAAEGNPAKAAELIREYRVVREAIPTELLNHAVVWEALLEDMPIGALIRNLPKMTDVGLLTPTSTATGKVSAMLQNQELLRKGRIHPLNVLTAQKTYACGYSLRGSSRWVPIPMLVDALDEAFYRSFGNVEATGKRTLLALDVSGSMTMDTINGVPGLTPRVASAAMAMVTARVGDPYEIIGFTGSRAERYGYRSGGRNSAILESPVPGVAPLTLSARQRLDDICRYVDGLAFGRTDCALPMIYARHLEREVDTFVIYTDNETWAGNMKPFQALAEYRKASGIPARLITVGMVSNGFTIADPRDAGMLDVVGFDTATPQLISGFSEGAF